MKRIVLSSLIVMASLTAIGQSINPKEPVDTVLVKLLTDKLQKFGRATGSYLIKDTWDRVSNDLNLLLVELYQEYMRNKKSEPKKD